MAKDNTNDRNPRTGLTTEESMLRYHLRPVTPIHAPSVLTQLIQTVGSTYALVGSTLSGTWPGEIYRELFNEAVGPARELAEVLIDVPFIPPSIDVFGLKRHDGLPLFQVRVVRRAPPDVDGWVVNFWCPWCMKDHEHRWMSTYDHCRAYYRRPHCVGDSPLKPSGYYLALEYASRQHIYYETYHNKAR